MKINKRQRESLRDILVHYIANKEHRTMHGTISTWQVSSINPSTIKTIMLCAMEEIEAEELIVTGVTHEPRKAKIKRK